jgi:hypothetical protein
VQGVRSGAPDISFVVLTDPNLAAGDILGLLINPEILLLNLPRLKYNLRPVSCLQKISQFGGNSDESYHH